MPAPPTIAKDPRFEAIHAARERAAANARLYQARYKTLTAGLIAATAVAAIVGGLILYGIDTAPGDLPDSPLLKQLVASRTAQVTLGVLQALSLAGAAYFSHLLRTSDHAERWLEERMKAEKGRLDRATSAIEIGHAQGPEAFRAGCTYFYEELVTGQKAYLEGAVARHEGRASRIAIAGGIVAGLGALAGLGGVGLAPLLLVGAFIGVISPALVAAVQSWQETSADLERAKLHSATWDRLNELAGQRAELDAAIASNDLVAAMAYAKKVCDVLKADHEAFASLRKGKVQR